MLFQWYGVRNVCTMYKRLHAGAIVPIHIVLADIGDPMIFAVMQYLEIERNKSMSKYIIDVGDAYVRHALGRKLIIPVIINNDTEYWVNTNIQLTPYTEPDTEKVRKEAYEQGLFDAKEGKATCQYCEYQYLDDTEEPCKKCCKAYMNKFKPKAKEQQIQVGDEVRNIRSGWTAVVVRISDDDCLTLMDGNGSGAIVDGYKITRFTKTGRHFPEIAAVLAKMKEGS